MRIPFQPEAYYRLSQLKQNQVFAAANRGGRITIVTVLAFVILITAANIASLWIYHEVGGQDIRTAALMSTLGWTLFLGPALVRFLALPLLAHRIGKELQRRAELEDRFLEEIR